LSRRWRAVRGWSMGGESKILGKEIKRIEEINEIGITGALWLRHMLLIAIVCLYHLLGKVKFVLK